MVKEKEWGYLWVTQDMCVWKGKLEVLSITCGISSTTDVTLTLRDGRDNTANIIFYSSYRYPMLNSPIFFPEPLPLQNGLYVEMGGGLDGVLVQWRPISELKIESES